MSKWSQFFHIGHSYYDMLEERSDQFFKWPSDLSNTGHFSERCMHTSHRRANCTLYLTFNIDWTYLILNKQAFTPGRPARHLSRSLYLV